MSNKSELEKKKREEMLRLYVSAAGNTLAGGLILGLMFQAIAEEQYFMSVVCGLIGGWNTVLGIKKVKEASNMRQR